MFAEELRLYNQIPIEISLEMSDGATASTVGEADNVVYFTREQFAAGLGLPVPSQVKQFLHFIRAPLALIHLNVFRILMGCSVLDFLYQLDISLVEICFIYTLKLEIGGRMSISAQIPWLQFVTGLLDSLKTEAKGVVLIKGSWFETLGSLGLSFNLNQSLSFPGLSSFPFWYACIDIPIFLIICRHAQAGLVGQLGRESEAGLPLSAV